MNLKFVRRIVLTTVIAIVFVSIQSEGVQAQARMDWVPEILDGDAAESVYLPDYSYAGYRWGEEEFPEFSTTIDVTEFGAVPDDGENDTEAIKKAFEKAHDMDEPVTVYLPKGQYMLTEILYIERSDFILKGAGSGEDGTIIYSPLQLTELPTPDDLKELEEYLTTYNKKEDGVPYSLYAWSGGYIWPRVPGKRVKAYMEKYNTKQKVLTSARDGKRGSHWMVVQSGKKLSVGEMYEVHWYNKEGKASSLIQHIYDNQVNQIKVGSRHWENPDIPLVSQPVTITRIAGDTVWTKAPLLNDIRPEWECTLTDWEHLENVGIEHLRFEYPYTEYRLHHVGRGYSPMYLTSLSHSWVDDITVHNGSNGVLSDDCANVTIRDFETTGSKYHYAVMMGEVHNMLAEDIRANADAMHSISLNTGATNCVFTDCQLNVNPTMDQHSGINYQNLFEEIYVEEPDKSHRYIDDGGAGYWKPSHGAFTTFWNIEVNYTFEHPSDETITVQGVQDGPSARIIGLNANYPVEIDYKPNSYIEGTNRTDLNIPSLYQYQLEQRLHR
ncbi:MAG: glycoside hydrolase family 55 protein [Candidatus Marinimicrobia bacterium]|nr:glycoside hydrolase family 55 protein [Candidatus Neomarinimicrobiota bacterium]MCF7828913.1 glycoside hydrolase family 55 protein [Candidatus Neomarinimicrobiota bacterium]MCF7879873.1 glycoside hydrolase family 55 protein [Candidatus Neomarinimicrobiota bacterium]